MKKLLSKMFFVSDCARYEPRRSDVVRSFFVQSMRFLPLAAPEIPIIVLAAVASVKGNFAVGCYLFLAFNLLFAPTLSWELVLCKTNRDPSPLKNALLSLAPLMLTVAALFLGKYTGPWIFWSVVGGVYFVANIAALAMLKKIRLGWLFVLTFVLQMILLWILCTLGE